MSSPSDAKTPILPTATGMQPQPLYHSFPLYTPYPQGVAYIPVRPKKSPARRFVRALIFAGLTWFLVKAFVHQFHRHGHWHFRFGSDLLYDGEWHYDIPSNVERSLDNCVFGQDWTEEDRDDGHVPFASSTTFEVPIADSLYLLSRGHFSGGKAEVVTSPDQAANSATVKIVARYYREEIRDLAKACTIYRINKTGENGVGIFTPVLHYHDRPRRREDTMYFETVVTLPEGSGGASPLSIKHFETDVPNTAQAIHSTSAIFFNSILLSGTNAPIFVQSINSTAATFGTTNSPIKGSFNSSSSLVLRTTNSPIQVEVGLESNGSKPITFSALTTNGLLQAEVSLLSTSSTGGEFDITTTTTNSPLVIGFPAAPVDSKLSLKASATNSPAKVFLHPTFEGRFDLTTSSIFRGEVKVHDEVADPSGKDRKREVAFTTVGRRIVEGRVRWADESEKKHFGSVAASTTNSPVVLDL